MQSKTGALEGPEVDGFVKDMMELVRVSVFQNVVQTKCSYEEVKLFLLLYSYQLQGLRIKPLTFFYLLIKMSPWKQESFEH